MSFKLQAAMASDEATKPQPRRFDLTMSRRTRRPAAATSATDRHEQDHHHHHHHHQAVDVEGSLLGGIIPAPFQPQPVVVLLQEPSERQDQEDGLFYLSDHLLQLQSRQAKLHAHHQEHEEEEEEECQDNSRRFSLRELIEDEAVDGGANDAATGGTEENAAAAAPEAAEGEAKRPGQGQQVAGRRVIGMMRRYVKVRSIKIKPKQKKAGTPVC